MGSLPSPNVALALTIQASCIRLFDRLSDIGVFGHQQMHPIGRIPKNDASKPESFEDILLLETVVIIAAIKRSQR